jgi:hypothetical protein
MFTSLAARHSSPALAGVCPPEQAETVPGGPVGDGSGVDNVSGVVLLRLVLVPAINCPVDVTRPIRSQL